MTKKEIIVIAGVAQNRVIGKGNNLPWGYGDIKGDLKRFKELTTGHPIIMGRSTYESIGKPLPNRLNIVLSRSNPGYSEKNLHVARSLEEALTIADIASPPVFDPSKIYIIGGSGPFEEAMEKNATRLEITNVRKDYEGDVKFPKINLDVWSLVNTIEIYDEVSNPKVLTHSYDTYLRK